MDLEWLGDWLREHQDVADETSIVHGDFRHGNLCFSPNMPAVAAIFDWELSTLGHPLSDLAYFCMPWHMSCDIPHGRGLIGLDLAAEGIPDEATIVSRYCTLTGRDGLPGWNVFLALSFFRLSAILHGVMARAIQGDASNQDAMEVGKRAELLASIGQHIARG